MKLVGYYDSFIPFFLPNLMYIFASHVKIIGAAWFRGAYLLTDIIETPDVHGQRTVVVVEMGTGENLMSNSDH